MKSIRSSMLLKLLILTVGALGASLGSAQAQSTVGKFTLPHEARWGAVLLPPGSYTFSLRSATLPAAVMVAKAGSAEGAIVLPLMVSDRKIDGHQQTGTRSRRQRRIIGKRTVPGRTRYEPALCAAEGAGRGGDGQVGTDGGLSAGEVKHNAEADGLKSASAFFMN